MRLGIVLFGVVLVVMGAVLSFVPLLPAGTDPGGIYYQSKSLVFPSYTTVAWSNGTANSYVAAFDCGSTAPTGIPVGGTPSQVCDGSPGTVISTGNGPSGTLSVSAPPGDWIVVASFTTGSGPVQPGTSLTATSTSGIIGIPILFLGMILIAVGGWLGERTEKARNARSTVPPGARGPYDGPSYEPYPQSYPPGYPEPYPGQPGYYPPSAGHSGSDPYTPGPGGPYEPPG